MKIPDHLPWATDLTAAKILQENLRRQIIPEDRFEQINYVAGVDVGFEQNYTITKGAVAVLTFPHLELAEKAIARLPTSFPYIPGYLSFREIPAILEAMKQITITPELILCDGQGIAHPRRFGLACHLGLIVNLPSIGVAKSLLIGKHEELPLTKGSWQPLIDGGEIVGAVVRSRRGVKPLYVSIGHKISLKSAIKYVLACTTKYRLPETTRWADKLASDPEINLKSKIQTLDIC
jgi:deoxyribonuclease V